MGDICCVGNQAMGDMSARLAGVAPFRGLKRGDARLATHQNTLQQVAYLLNRRGGHINNPEGFTQLTADVGCTR